MNGETCDVAVIGGGLAGLTVANYLAGSGYAVTVFEAASEPGGRARTREDRGFLFNMGPHALYEQGAAAEVLAELGVAWRGGRPGSDGAFLTLGGGSWPMPGGLFSVLNHELFSVGERFRLLRFFQRLPKLDTSGLQGEGLENWLSREGPGGRANDFVRVLVRLASYAHDTHRLSAGVGLEQLRLGLAGVRYLDGGWQTLVDGLREKARAAGVRVQNGARLVSMDRQSQGVVLGFRDAGPVYAQSVVLAVDPDTAFAILGTRAGAALARFDRQRFPVRAACLDLGLRGGAGTPVNFALDLENPWYYSVHSKSARLAPEQGETIQLARYGGDSGSTRRDLEAWMDRLQPDWRDRLVAARYLRGATVMNALPTADMNGLQGRPGPGDSGCDGVFLCGDWVGSRGILSDASMASARTAAGMVAGYLKRRAA